MWNLMEVVEQRADAPVLLSDLVRAFRLKCKGYPPCEELVNSLDRNARQRVYSMMLKAEFD